MKNQDQPTNQSKEKNKGGRKIKYNENFPKAAYELAKEGYLNKDIAKKLGISEETFYQYINQFPEFSESLKRGQPLAIQQVENSLFREATGYEFTERHEEVSIDSEGNAKPVSVKTIVKWMRPQASTIFFFLTNRAKQDWSNQQNIKINGTITNRDYKDLTVEELDKKILELGSRN